MRTVTRRQRGGDTSVVCPVEGCHRVFSKTTRTEAKRAIGSHISKKHRVKLPIALCIGPLHRVPVWLPKSDFWTRWNGTQKVWLDCKECERFKVYGNRNHGLVPFEKVRPYVERLTAHYGSQKRAARAAGVCVSTIEKPMQGRRAGLQKRTAAKIVVAAHRLDAPVERDTVPIDDAIPPLERLVAIAGDQPRAAERAGLSLGTVNKILRRRYVGVRAATLEKIEAALE